MRESRAAAFDPRIVDWDASVDVLTATHRLVTSEGGDIVQRYRFLLPGMSVTAHADGVTQTRTLHGHRGICQQGGDEILARFALDGAMRRIADEALELLAAPNCPSGTMDVLLMPDQMILQIHESIGHPLELDRILGDERNFAGTSFVTPDMFGSYRYGSELLNVTFDPTRGEELASYGWDDEGAPAERVHLIRNGILERPLGGATSQLRAGLPGTSNARADNWNRPPIDRMANLNIEPGDATLRRHDRRHRARRADGDQLLVVDRRLAQQVPVRLRARTADRERQARRGRQESQLPRHQRDVLAQPRPRRQRRHGAGAGLAALRQGRAVAGHPRRPRVARLRVQGRGRLRRGTIMAPRGETASVAAMESYFHDVAAVLDGLVAAGETYTASFSAEASDFVRFNRGKVRQPGNVVQRYVDVDLIHGARHASHRLSLVGRSRRPTRERLRAAVAGLRAALPDLDADPHLLIATDVVSTRAARGGPLPPAEAVIDDVLGAARGQDLVGLYAGGPVCRGFANSFGQRNWHEATSLQPAVEPLPPRRQGREVGAVGLRLGRAARWRRRWTRRARCSRTSPGPRRRSRRASTAHSWRPRRWRTSAGCSAGAGSRRGRSSTKQSSLTRMQGGDGARLDPRVTIGEAIADGIAPAFQSEGFARPERVPLIDAGRLVGALVSPRTAREFSLAANGANGYEAPEALVMDGGTLAARDALAALGTGLYVGNLHYLNYSDRPACRMTGMTRFATFWVEDGEDRGAGERAALRRHDLPDARDEPRGAHGGDRADSRIGHLSRAGARQHAASRRAPLRADVHAVAATPGGRDGAAAPAYAHARRSLPALGIDASSRCV